MIGSNYLIINGFHHAVFFKGNCVSSLFAQNDSLPPPQATGMVEKFKLIKFYIKGNCFDRHEIPKIRIEILVTGTKIEACH